MFNIATKFKIRFTKDFLIKLFTSLQKKGKKEINFTFAFDLLKLFMSGQQI